jgi:hypothetical protein
VIPAFSCSSRYRDILTVSRNYWQGKEDKDHAKSIKTLLMTTVSPHQLHNPYPIIATSREYAAQRKVVKENNIVNVLVRENFALSKWNYIKDGILSRNNALLKVAQDELGKVM